MNESEMATQLIEHLQQSESPPDQIELEAHYNHFGDRGVVDVYIEFKNLIQLFELKSESALEDSTGANEIIRQFKRMRRYYFEDESNNDPGKHIEFKLAFYPTQITIDHIKANSTLYDSIRKGEKEKLHHQTRVRVSEVLLHDGKVGVPANENTLAAIDEFLDEEFPVIALKRSFDL